MDISTLCLYLPIYKVQKSGIAEKDIAYLGILTISHYADAINKPSYVSLKV